MGLVEILVWSPLAFTFGWLLEPPFDRYVLPVVKAWTHAVRLWVGWFG